MKITKTQLKQIIKEELSTIPVDNLVGGIAGLVQGMDPDNVSELFLQVYRQLPDVDIEMHDVEEEPEPEMRRQAGFGSRERVPVDLPPQGKIRSPGLEEMIREEITAILEAGQYMGMGVAYKRDDDRVSKKISHLESEEDIPHDQAVAMAINMDKEGRLTQSGEYKKKGKK